MNDEPLAGQPAGRILLPGAVLAGRFRIVALLGEGAMGEVYEAEDLELGERVAVKVLRPEIAWDERVLKRFKREIQLARKVTHPHVCRVFDLFFHRFGGEGEGGATLAFVTMELLAGETLEERLARDGRMSVGQILPLVRQMAEGLDAAHRVGVIHRDFKSGNVMLTPPLDGSPEGLRAMVTDFGLAWSSAGSASLTTTGVLLGSPAYMAPEQVRGEEVTAATDIYSLGVVLYEMATGSLPFSADTAFGTAIKRLREPPTLPRRHAPDLDPRLESVILRCLESDPRERFATPGEVATALEQAAATPGSGERRRRRRVRWPAVAVAAALAAAAGIGVWVVAAGRPAAAPTVEAAKPAGPRPAVAVLGFQNLSPVTEAAYIGEALVRLLPPELAAGGKLRPLQGERLDQARRDFALTRTGSPPADALARARTGLGADLVITGSYFVEPGGSVRCMAEVRDCRTGETVASFTEQGTEAELLDLVDRLGERLRDELGVGRLSAEAERGVRVARPANTGAARLYAEGLALRARFELLPAVAALERAREADPANPFIRAELAATLAALGRDEPARQEGTEAFNRSSALGAEERRLVEARYREAIRDWDRAGAAYGDLWDSFPDDPEHGLALARTQIQAGRYGDALATVEKLRATPAPGTETRADLLEAEAALRQADSSRGHAAAVRAAERATRQGSYLLAARGLHFQGVALRQLGRLDEAKAASEGAARLFQEAGDRASEADALNNLGSCLLTAGDTEGARRLYERVIESGTAIGSGPVRALGLTNLGGVLMRQGDLEGARLRFNQALTLFREAANRNQEAQVLNNLGLIYLMMGRRPEARAMFGESVRALHEMGDRNKEAQGLANLGRLTLDEGRVAEARELFERALRIHRQVEDPRGGAMTRGALAHALFLGGEPAAARREMEAAIVTLEGIGAAPLAAQQRLALARFLVDSGDVDGGETLALQAQAQLAGGQPDDVVLARTILAAVSLERGKPREALAAMERLAEPLAKCQNDANRRYAAVIQALAKADAGPAGARKAAARRLAELAEEADRGGLKPAALEIRFALGQLEIDGLDPAAGRARIAAVEREARAAGLGWLQRQAAEALRPRPTVS